MEARACPRWVDRDHSPGSDPRTDIKSVSRATSDGVLEHGEAIRLQVIDHFDLMWKKARTATAVVTQLPLGDMADDPDSSVQSRYSAQAQQRQALISDQDQADTPRVGA